MIVKKKEEILKFLIRNYAINSNNTFDSLFDNNISRPKCFGRMLKDFEHNYQFYVNRYMALSYIYQSLINVGSTFSTITYLQKEKIFELDSVIHKYNYQISLNEPFAHQIIIQYSKLYEALVDPETLMLYQDTEKKNNNLELNNHQIRKIKQAKKILDDDTIREKYLYLSKLITKIAKSGALDLRNNIFAHPFKNEDSGSVVFLESTNDKIFHVLKELCDDKDQESYNNSKNRIEFFCNKYLMVTSYNFKGSLKGDLRLTTQAKEHIEEIYKFMKTIRDVKLLSEEPLLQVNISTAKEELAVIMKDL